MQYYYINNKDQKDGPHDSVTIMRRVRSGVIRPDTLVCSEYDGEFVPAHTVDDLSFLFNRPTEDIRGELKTRSSLSLAKALKSGWSFVSENQVAAVFAGGVLILASLVGILLREIAHSPAAGATAGFLMFMFLQSCFFAVSLRVYRGQKAGVEFIEHSLSPVVGKLAFVGVLFSLMMVGGLPLLVLPSVVVFLFYAYLPMFILDYNFGISVTLKMIFAMLRKLDFVSLLKLLLLVLFYMTCIIFIFPIPLIMPIMAGALCSIYEDLSSM